MLRKTNRLFEHSQHRMTCHSSVSTLSERVSQKQFHSNFICDGAEEIAIGGQRVSPNNRHARADVRDRP
jgi:hypothetical protein